MQQHILTGSQWRGLKRHEKTLKSCPSAQYPAVCTLQFPLTDFMLSLSKKTLPLYRGVGALQIYQTIGGEGPAGVWDCLQRSTRALVCRICLTRVIESVLNYYSNWRACLTVELPVKRVGQKPEPVKACQSMETRSVGLMDFSTPLCLRTQQTQERGGGKKIKNQYIVMCECVSHQTTRWFGTVFALCQC